MILLYYSLTVLQSRELYKKMEKKLINVIIIVIIIYKKILINGNLYSKVRAYIIALHLVRFI